MTETAHIEALVKAAQGAPSIVKLEDGRTFAFRPQGNGAFALDNITQPHLLDAPIPKFVTQAVKMQTADSMIDYVNRFKNDMTVMFANIDENKVIGIIDYHHESTAEDGTRVKADLGKHTATLELPFSEEWTTWNGVSGDMMSHLDFATFLEENGVDVVDPRGAALLELCRDLQGTRNVKFGSVVRAGDVDKIDYQKDSGAASKGGVELPVSITLSIPVYFGGDKVSITAFLRRRVDGDGQLTLGVKLNRAEQVRQAEFHAVMDNIQLNTDQPLMYGAPA